MPESTIEPQTIEIDQIKNGVAEILIHWNSEQINREDEITCKDEILWKYDECRLKWVLPRPMTMTEIQAYFKENEKEILDWAKGSKVNL